MHDEHGYAYAAGERQQAGDGSAGDDKAEPTEDAYHEQCQRCNDAVYDDRPLDDRCDRVTEGGRLCPVLHR